VGDVARRVPRPAATNCSNARGAAGSLADPWRAPPSGSDTQRGQSEALQAGPHTAAGSTGLSSGLSCHSSPPSARAQGCQPSALRTLEHDSIHKLTDLESVLAGSRRIDQAQIYGPRNLSHRTRIHRRSRVVREFPQGGYRARFPQDRPRPATGPRCLAQCPRWSRPSQVSDRPRLVGSSQLAVPDRDAAGSSPASIQ